MENFLTRKRNKKSCVLGFNTLVSIILYIASPKRYDFLWVLLTFLFFIISFITLFWKKKNFFCFSFLFSITFGFVYFAYPLLIYPINKTKFFMFALNFNEDVITKATCLVLIGYNFFCLGINNKIKEREYKLPKVEINYSTNILNYILIFLIFIEFVKVFVLHANNPYAKSGGSESALWEYIGALNNSIIIAVLTISFYRYLYFNKSLKEKKKCKICIILSLIDVLIVSSTGSRTLLIEIGLIIVFIYMYLKGIQFSFFRIFMLLLCGFILLSLIVILRSGGAFVFSFNIIDMAMDLIINNYTLYLGYDYVKNNGVEIFPFIGSILSLIPFLSGFVCSLLGIPKYKAFSAIFLTHLVFGDKAEFGVGTNIIVSLYLSLGIFGVILFMYFLGVVVHKLEDRISKEKVSVYLLLIFFELFSVCVFMVRAEYFCWIGNFTYAIMFIYLFNKNVFLENKEA